MDAMRDDDDELRAWRAGDQAAGERLFDRYYDPVARFFFNKVGDASPDLIQKTFLACVEGLPRFRGEGSFRSYVFAIAYRQLCRHFREAGRARFDPASDSVVAADPSLSRVVEEQQEIRLRLLALRRIPLDLQVVFELHHWEECSVAEIATILEIPSGTVKSRLRRGREQLREAIEQLAANPELAESTFHGLETWAREVRARWAPHARTS
jgi:RNA polymerase sigma-70 factor (ECF subfamily)